jgi:hypothetical protein
MSLLSTPTARPDRVFSLVSLVRALGGRVTASDAKEWLAPAYRTAESTPPKDGDRVREVFRVARDLKLLDADQNDWVSQCELPATRRAFAHHVHAHLCGLESDDPDAVLLRAYAWCVAYAEANGTSTVLSRTAKELVREIAAALGRSNEQDEDPLFNSTKWPAWKDWMVFLGLGWNDLPGTSGFLLDPSRRIEEEILALTLSDSRLDAKSFVVGIAKTFPYLDNGTLFEAACSTGLARPPKGQLSRVLSQAIRALQDEGILRCEMVGDARDGVALFPDPLSSTNAFSHIQQFPGVSHV